MMSQLSLGIPRLASLYGTKNCSRDLNDGLGDIPHALWNRRIQYHLTVNARHYSTGTHM